MVTVIRNNRWVSGLLVVALVVGAWSWFKSSVNAAQLGEQTTESPAENARQNTTAVRVLTIFPATGGTSRQTSLPCSAHWHDYSSLCSKVSGYLGEELSVDIGSRVKRGEVLAKIDVPELDQDVSVAEATLAHTLATVDQAEARKKSAIAEQRASEAAVVKAQTDVERWTAETTFREKEHRRFAELNRTDSVQRALVDEKLFQLQSVQAGQRAAESAVLSAREQAAAAAARVELAEADLLVSKAQAKISEANLDKAKLYASFSSIVAPYDGVITARHFHKGDFIRAADKGNERPLLMIGRTDLIRVVVQIPDREVPYAHAGDPVTIEFDALPEQTFQAKLSRIAFSEDTATRTMRAEVDLPNEEGRILDQMYGRMQIVLEPAGNTLKIPSTCLVGNLALGSGQVFVANDRVVRLQPVSVGAHDGVSCEILSGLKPTDQVVIRPPANLTEGTPIDAQPSADLSQSASKGN